MGLLCPYPFHFLFHNKETLHEWLREWGHYHEMKKKHYLHHLKFLQEEDFLKSIYLLQNNLLHSDDVLQVLWQQEKCSGRKLHPEQGS